ncbi:MAG: hypothetical protein LBS04_02385 [Tannerellaceae bacterium]|jgi:preprotein translocase subunit SecG|nr:hypothetical protein [Tannerellaceae bacterium]
MNDEEVDRLIDESLEIPIPEGLSARLEAHIDALAANEKKRKTRRFMYRTTAAIAIVLLCIGIFLEIGKQPPTPSMTDTFSDPEEAAIAAGQALTLMSAQLNKGIGKIENAGQEIEKVNQLLDKHLNN